jgi:2'-5' RNA ligase
MTFKFEGFRQFGNFLFGKRVVAVNIVASTELEQLRSDLVNVLSQYCELGKFDKKDWKPHATLAFKDIDHKFKQIKEFVDNQNCPPIRHYVLRLALVKNARILCEYDFLQKRFLMRHEALDGRTKRLSIIPKT